MGLFEHQKRALALMTEHPQFALLMEQGTGKTLPVLYHLTNLIMAGKVDKALVVAPKFVKESWYRDIEKLPSWRRTLASEHITVTHYDIVWRRDEFAGYYDAIVLDEAHNICNRTAKRTQWAIGCKKGKKTIDGANKRSEYRYILTGTPMDKGKLEQFYCLFEFLIPNYFGTYKEFCSRYLIQRQLPGTFVNIIVGYRHKDELLEKVGDYSLRVLKKDCLDLPDKLEPEVILCENKEKKLYKEAEDSYIMELLMNFDNPLVKSTKLRQIATGFITDDDGTVHDLKCQKPKILQELLESILPSKVVIFYEFKHSIATITAMLDKMKIKYVAMNGETKDKSVWKKFQEDDSIKVFLGQYRSAKEGIDLFSSTHMIFYEPCRDTRTLTQATDRIHRYGVKHPCSYYYLLTEGTIEENIYKRLQKGEDFNIQYLRSVAQRGSF